jgi:glycosyltransferase involved in cell wall biosynthesis
LKNGKKKVSFWPYSNIRRIEMNTKSTICFVLPSLLYGGAELQTIQHINALSESGYKVYLILLSELIDKELQNQIVLADRDILILRTKKSTPGFSSILFAHLQVFKIYGFLRSNQIRVVVANLPLSHFYLRLVKIWSFIVDYKFRLINYNRSLQYSANPIDSLTKKIYHVYNSFLAKKADNANIFISQASLKDVQAHFPVINPVVIHNSVPFKNIPRSIGDTYFNEHNLNSKFVVVVPGRLHPSKGHKFFINCFKEFLLFNNIQKSSEIRVIFAGGLILEKELRDIVKKEGLNDFIHITGTIQNNLLLSFLKISNVVVIPSIHEGFGNIVIESLMQEALVLASDAGGIPEIIIPSFNGFLFKKLDENDFLDKFQAIYTGKTSVNRTDLLSDFNNRFSFSSHIRKLNDVLCMELQKLKD